MAGLINVAVQRGARCFAHVQAFPGKALEIAAKVGLVASVAIGGSIVMQALTMSDIFTGVMLSASGCALFGAILGVKAALTGKKTEAAGWLILALGSGVLVQKSSQFSSEEKLNLESAVSKTVAQECPLTFPQVPNCRGELSVCQGKIDQKESSERIISSIVENVRRSVQTSEEYFQKQTPGVDVSLIDAQDVKEKKIELSSCQALLKKKNTRGLWGQVSDGLQKEESSFPTSLEKPEALVVRPIEKKNGPGVWEQLMDVFKKGVFSSLTTLGNIKEQISRSIEFATQKTHIIFGSTYVGGNSQRDKLSQMVDKTHEEYAKKWDLQYRVVAESRLKGACDKSVQKRHIIFGSTYVGGNSQRDKLSQMVDKTHEEYAKKWDLQYRVVAESRLKGACDKSVSSTERVECVPYWNKIAVLRDFLNEEAIPGKEEWYVLADDDMPVTNMRVDPFTAIDLLRRGIDTSIIVARDVVLWRNGNLRTSVNTGLLFVRKDKASKAFIDDLWTKRNSPGTGKDHCRTLGTCRNQDTLHEQQAMAMVLEQKPFLLDKVVTVVTPRDTYNGEEIAINTFKRDGCFSRKQEGWGSARFSYFESDRDYPEGAWRIGDWMGQTAGVPVLGNTCEDAILEPRPIRQHMLQGMIDKIVR